MSANTRRLGDLIPVDLIKNNCHLLHGYLGYFVGINTLILILFGFSGGLTGAQLIGTGLGLALIASVFTAFIYCCIYLYKFKDILLSTLIPSLILSFFSVAVVEAAVQRISLNAFQGLAFLMAPLMAFAGILLGRLLCRICQKGHDHFQGGK